MYEDARQHQQAAYFYKLAIMTGAQRAWSNSEYTMDTVLIGLAEAYDGEWQDTGALPYCMTLLALSMLIHGMLIYVCSSINPHLYMLTCLTCSCVLARVSMEIHSCASSPPHLPMLSHSYNPLPMLIQTSISSGSYCVRDLYAFTYDTVPLVSFRPYPPAE